MTGSERIDPSAHRRVVNSPEEPFDDGLKLTCSELVSENFGPSILQCVFVGHNASTGRPKEEDE